MALQGKAPPQHILRQSVDSQRDKLPPFVAQQRRRIALQHVTQCGDQPLKTILMADAALQFNGDFRQHIYRKTHCRLIVILTICSVTLTIPDTVKLTTMKVPLFLKPL